MSDETLIIAKQDLDASAPPNVLRVSPGPTPLVVQFHNGLHVYIVNDKCSVVSFEPVDGVTPQSLVRRSRPWVSLVVVSVFAFSLGYVLREIKN